MRIVIQCAARKNPGGSFVVNGRTVLFVARPDLAPPSDGCAYARPDDLSDGQGTWRQRLLQYNRDGNKNPLGLLPAYRLYKHTAYRELVERFGLEKVFILSAGWGLIPAGFMTPPYDISFSAQAQDWMRRRKGDGYDDFRLIPDDGGEVVFLGGKDYLPLFCELVSPLKGRKRVIFNSARAPQTPAEFVAVRFPTTTRTNWHYEAARSLIAGELGG